MTASLSYYNDRLTHQPVAFECWLTLEVAGTVRITHPPLPEFNHARMYKKYGARAWRKLTPEEADTAKKVYREGGIEAAKDYLSSSLVLFLIFEKEGN